VAFVYYYFYMIHLYYDNMDHECKVKVPAHLFEFCWLYSYKISGLNLQEL
jgi:hypothetical protein